MGQARAAYVIKIGNKYWSRDKTKSKRQRQGKNRAFKLTLKDFYGAGILTTLALAKRVANQYRGAKVMPVTITEG